MSNLTQAAGQKALYISSNKYAAVAAWAPATVHAVGDIVRPTGKSNLTFTQANPGVFTWKDNSGAALTHNFASNERIVFTNNGDTLPTALSFGTTYYVRSPTGSTFNLSTTYNGGNIDTTAGSQAGTHLATVNVAGPELRQLCYICITAGTTAASLEPVWPGVINTNTTRGNTVTDGTVVWMEATGIPILNGDATHTPNWNTGSKTDSGNEYLGQVITDNLGTHVFIIVTAGAGSNTTEPTWNTAAVGNTTTDTTQVWEYIGTVASWQARKWAAPFYAVVDAFGSGWGDGSNGGTQMFFVGNSHHDQVNTRSWAWNNYTNRSAFNSPAYIISINEAGNVPPTQSDLATGAICETVQSNAFAGFPYHYAYGIEIRAATSGQNMDLWMGYNGASYWEKCIFNISCTGGGDLRSYETTELHNCQAMFGATGQNIFAANGTFYWHNDDPTLPGFLSGTVASVPGLLSASGAGAILVEGVDLATNQSGTTYPIRGGGGYGFGDLTIRNCKIPSGLATAIAGYQSGPGFKSRIINCNNGAVFNYCETADWRGQMNTDEVTYRGSGASIQGANFSWKFTPQYNVDNFPWASLPISAINTNIASTVTVTVYGVASSSALAIMPTDQQVWLELDFLGSTGSPLTSGFTTRASIAPLSTGSALTADTSTWSGAAPARINNHAYSPGDVISLASNPTRLFQCSLGGLSAGSEPGGYASATDGGLVTDGVCEFVVGVRFKIVATLSTHPLVTGPINARIRQSGGKAADTTHWFWFDPVLYLS